GSKQADSARGDRSKLVSSPRGDDMKTTRQRDTADDSALTSSPSSATPGKSPLVQRLVASGRAGAAPVVQASVIPGAESLGSEAGALGSEAGMTAALLGQGDGSLTGEPPAGGLRSSRFRGIALLERAAA